MKLGEVGVSQSPFVVSISNRKGGTGKTTTAVNLAVEFARRDYQVLLIDLDTQGHAAVGLDITCKRGMPTAQDMFREQDFQLVCAIMPTVVSGLHFVPSDQNFEHIRSQDDTLVLKQQISKAVIAEQYDIIVIDTPPSLDALLINAMAAANGILIPMLPHHLSGEGVRQLSRLFFRIGSTINPNLQLLGLLPVMVDREIEFHRRVIAQMCQQYGTHRLFRGIRTDIRLAEAFAARKPIQLYSPKSRGSLDYYVLAEDLLCMWQDIQGIMQRRKPSL